MPRTPQDGDLSRAFNTLLTRVGASAIAPDVTSLADQLAGLAAVVEAVHGDVLAALCGGQGEAAAHAAAEAPAA